MFELRWLELFIKAQLIMATEVAVVKEEKKRKKRKLKTTINSNSVN